MNTELSTSAENYGSKRLVFSLSNKVSAWRAASATCLFLLSTAFTFGQVTYTGTTSNLVVSGTSTMHDWDMKSVKSNCTAVFEFNTAGQIKGLTALSFSTPVNSLKSDHSGMDKNAYKALKSDKNPAIIYTMASVSVTPAAEGTSTVKCTGKLSVAGTTLSEDVVAVCKLNADNTITVTGSRTISMKDFNMEPPTFMLGTIKTGNDVVLKFNLVLKKS